MLLSRVKVWVYAGAGASTNASGSSSAVPVRYRWRLVVGKQQDYALALLMGPWEKRGQSLVMRGELVSSPLIIWAIIGARNGGIAYSTKK